MLSCLYMQAHSLYFHIPFCKRRCAYCDFNTYAGMERWIPAYLDALCREIELVANSSAERLPVHTVFFGGGTPSLLPIEGIERILEESAKHFIFQPDMEITLEANPGTLTPEYLRSLRGLGVNRLSLGMQSAHPQELKLLTRLHDYHDVIQSVSWARQAGFDNLSLDLIFGLPGQSLDRWQQSLDLAMGLAPEHISLYSLIVEEGTPMFSWSARGLVDLPDNDQAADMYELAMSVLEPAGYTHYEISNWAVKGPNGKLRSCRHNLQYWRGLPYLGFGAGAHGYAGGWRTADVNPIWEYIQRSMQGESQPFPRSPANAAAHAVERKDDMGEFMMVGLRLTDEGVSDRIFSQRYGIGLDEKYGKPVARLTKAGLIEWVGEDGDKILRLTRRGRLLGNQVFVEFI